MSGWTCQSPEETRQRLAGLLSGREADYPEAVSQLRIHYVRFHETLRRVAPATGGTIADFGGTALLVPAYLGELGYSHVTLTNSAPDERYTLESLLRSRYDERALRLRYFDLESDHFPLEAGAYDSAVCTEVLEHMARDPMALMSGINRSLRAGGRLLLTTPNVASLAGMLSALLDRHPSVWPYYCDVALQHKREYTSAELRRLLLDAGFDQVEVRGFGVRPATLRERVLWFYLWPLRRLWGRDRAAVHARFLVASAVKTAEVRDRYPDWLYCRALMPEPKRR